MSINRVEPDSGAARRWSAALGTPLDFGLFVGISGLCALLVALRPLNFLSDDSLFYLVIADHIAAGQGSTFNGLFPTNGYHPLWELCAALLALIPHTKAILLGVGVAFQWLCTVATVSVLLGTLRTTFGRSGIAIFLSVIILLFVPMGNLFWTEAPLTMFFLAVLFAMSVSPATLRFAPVGIVLGLLFLSRLDNVFLVGCFVVGLWMRDRDWRLALSCAICAAIAAAYLITNQVAFGHVVPISGAIKSATFRHNYFSGQLGANGLLSLAGAVGLALVNSLRRSRPRRYRIAAISLASGVILQSLYIVALTYGDTWWAWYYVPGYLCVALLAAEVGEWLPRIGPLPTGRTVLALSVAIAAGIATLRFSVNASLHDPAPFSGNWRSQWIEEIARALPEDRSVLVVFDQPGLFAYGTSHPVLSLDGLTSNYTVDASLATRGMYAQLAGLGDAYLVAPRVADGARISAAVTSQRGIPGGQIVHFATPLKGEDAGCIRVDGSGLVTTLEVPRALHGGNWGVWKLTPRTMRSVRCPAGDSTPARSSSYSIQF